jgi:hypothetical protein
MSDLEETQKLFERLGMAIHISAHPAGNTLEVWAPAESEEHPDYYLPLQFDTAGNYVGATNSPRS